MLRRPRLVLSSGLVLAALLLAACSNTVSPVSRIPKSGTATATVVNGVQQVTVQAVDFRFTPSTIYVHTGSMVRIVLVHAEVGAPHNWQLNGFANDYVPAVSTEQPQASQTFMAPAPGRYQFICTFHAKLGQTGTLVVLP